MAGVTVASVSQKRARGSESRDERRAQLLDAATEAIRAIGPGATMEQLARAGGVTKPILYRHFTDRDGLIAAISERFATDLLTSVTTPLAGDADARDLLRSTVDGYVAFIERETNLYRFMLHQLPGRDGGYNQVSALVDLIAKQVAVVIGSRLRAVAGDSGAAVPWAYGIVGLVHQAGDWWVSDRSMSRAELVDYLVSMLWDGLSATAPPPQRTA